MTILTNTDTKYDKKPYPFFIIGSGRSGTTLLRMILCSHSKITIPPETWYIIPLVKELPINKMLDRLQISRAIDIVTSHYRWPDMGISTKELISKINDLKVLFLKDILNIIYDSHLKLHGKSRWGDKTPPYIQIVPELNALYPDAKFIHLIRDGRDVTKSFHDKRWFGPFLHKNVKEWKSSINISATYKNKEYSNRIIEIKYENLVTNIEDVVRKICLFIDESFEPQMLQWRKNIKDNVPLREIDIHNKLFRPPRHSDLYRWQRELNKKEIFIIEAHLKRELNVAGYDLLFNKKCWSPLFTAIRIYLKCTTPIINFINRLFNYIERRLK